MQACRQSAPERTSRPLSAPSPLRLRSGQAPEKGFLKLASMPFKRQEISLQENGSLKYKIFFMKIPCSTDLLHRSVLINFWESPASVPVLVIRGKRKEITMRICLMENRRSGNREEHRQCSNLYSTIPGIQASTKTCVFGFSAIHSEELKGEEGLNPPGKRDWFLNLGTQPGIEWGP